MNLPIFFLFFYFFLVCLSELLTVFSLFRVDSFFLFFFLFKYLYLLNLYFLFFSILILSIFFYFTESVQIFFNNFSFNLKKFLKFGLILQIIVSFLIFFISFLAYIFYLYKFYWLFSEHDYFFLPKKLNVISFFLFDISLPFFVLNFSVDIFGFSLLFLSYVTGLISLFVLDGRIFWINLKYYFIFNIFVIIVYFYVSVTNLFLFFFFYEALLLPSFLFVYFISPSKRAIQASIYFIIWTQIGSILVLLVFSYFIVFLNVFDFFSLKNVNLGYLESFFIYCLLFFGFGFKVPIWPFHYWLTKTHVEAPSGFSIYLSGFLVKSALFGFYKVSTNLLLTVDSSLFLVFCFFSVFDSSLKMWGQTDLKKLAAYGTIQEMNLIYLILVLGDVFSVFCAVLFVVTHAFLSIFMFFLVDCIYRRFHTRSIISINGILSMCPNLAIAIITMLVFFSGLPGTLKFTVEFFLFSGLIEYSIFFCFFLILVANILGLIGFSKNWLNSIFGLKIKKVSFTILDLTSKEIVIVFLVVFYLVYFSYFFNFFVL